MVDVKKILVILVALSFYAYANQNFEYAVEKLIKFEGGDKIDKSIGNAYSKFGITTVTLKRYNSKLSLSNINKAQAKDIIYKLYWEEFELDRFMDKRNALLVLDFCYNSSSHNAIKQIQRAIGSKVTGKLSTSDVSKINYMGYKDFYSTYKEYRLRYWKSLRIYNKFRKGWYKRLKELGEL